MASHNPFSYSLSSFFCYGRQLPRSEVLSQKENKTRHKIPTTVLHITYPKQQHRPLEVTEIGFQGPWITYVFLKSLEIEMLGRNKVTVCVI